MGQFKLCLFSLEEHFQCFISVVLAKPHLLFLVLVHFSQSQEVFNEKHKVDPTQSSQTLPHSVQIFLMTMMSLHIHPRILMVVIMASLRLKHLIIKI